MTNEAHKFRSEKQTASFAKKFGAVVLANSQNTGAVVIGLVGDLGTGKTTFVKYFLESLGTKEPVTSPTFLIIRPYRIQQYNFSVAYHVDCYRLDSSKELADLGFKNIIANPNHVVLVEWADKVRELMPESTIWAELSHGKGKTERIFVTRG